MNTDALKNSLQFFLKWRAEKDYRKEVKTRQAMLNYCGIHATIDNGKMYVANVENYFDIVWTSEEDRHCTGYYADNMQWDCIRFGVVKIGHKKGKGEWRELYAPFTWQDNCDGQTIHINCVGDFEDCKRWADNIAEREAENCREENAKYEAEQDIYNARESIHDINKKCLTLLKEIKSQKISPAICDALREKMQDYLLERKKAFKTIKARQENYWSAVY